MAASTTMTSRADLKTVLNITGTADDDRLDLWAEMAADAIEQYCNRLFAQASVTEYQDGRGVNKVRVDRPPIDATTYAVYDKGGDDTFDNTADLIDAEDYEVCFSEGIIVYRDNAFERYTKNVKIAYTGGYLTLPSAVKAAHIAVTTAWFTRAKQHGFGIANEGVADYRVAYESEGIPPNAKHLLDPFVLRDRSAG